MSPKIYFLLVLITTIIGSRALSTDINSSFSYQSLMNGDITFHLSSVIINGTMYSNGYLIMSIENYTLVNDDSWIVLRITVIADDMQIANKLYKVNIVNRDVYTLNGVYIGKTIFFISTPLSNKEKLFEINSSFFTNVGYKIVPLEIDETKIEKNIVNTFKGPQEAYEIEIEFKFNYYGRNWNKSYESIDVLIYDYDTGLLVSWPVLYISPELLAMGIEDIEYAEKYISEIKITFDLGDPAYPPWIIVLLKNMYIVIFLAIISIISIVILRKRRKSIKREPIIFF